MDKFFETTDTFFEKAENRFGIVTISVITGVLFLLFASLFSSIRLETFYHGNGFTRLSQHPFEMQSENDLRFRILSPLLGYILFFRGPAFKYFMLIVLALFLGLVYLFLRKKDFRPSEAIGIAAICALSTITFHQFYFSAYTDPLSYVLILLFMNFYKRIFLGTLLLTLMLFNHENTLFLFPFFFLLSLDGNYTMKNISSVLLRFLIAILPYLIFRKIISSYAEVNFTLSYYFDPQTMKWTREHVAPHLLSGIFQAFRFAWIIPLAALTVNFYERRYREIILINVIIVFVLAQLLIAWDISRLVGLAFPAILISAMRMKSFLGTKKFLYLIYFVFLINFFIPAYYIGALEPVRYLPFWLK